MFVNHFEFRIVYNPCKLFITIAMCLFDLQFTADYGGPRLSTDPRSLCDVSNEHLDLLMKVSTISSLHGDLQKLLGFLSKSNVNTIYSVYLVETYCMTVNR